MANGHDGSHDLDHEADGHVTSKHEDHDDLAASHHQQAEVGRRIGLHETATSDTSDVMPMKNEK